MSSARLALWSLPLLLAGCAGAEITDWAVPDKDEPVMRVESRVFGLAHVQQFCKVQATSSKFQGEGAVVMSAGGEEELVDSYIRDWQGSPETSLAPGAIRLRFIYNNGVLHEQIIQSPVGWDPIELAKGPTVARAQPEPEPEQPARPSNGGGEEPKVTNVLDSGPKAGQISTSDARPTPVDPNDGTEPVVYVKLTPETTQYAVLPDLREQILVKGEVRSLSSPGANPKLTRIKLLDPDGRELEDDEVMVWVEPGGSPVVEPTRTWRLFGAHRIVLQTADPEGVEVRVWLERDPVPGGR